MRSARFWSRCLPRCTDFRSRSISCRDGCKADYPNVDWFSHDAGHLLEMMFGWKTNPHAGPFHILSFVFIGAGFMLISDGLESALRRPADGNVGDTGPYSYVRHPQYVGFILVMFGFLLQWPTLLTLAMFPVLVVMYVKLARNEEREALATFGDDYRRYMAEVPGFIPHLSRLFGGPIQKKYGNV